MRFPSGDHEGDVSWAGGFASRTGLVPSEFISQISDPATTSRRLKRDKPATW